MLLTALLAFADMANPCMLNAIMWLSEHGAHSPPPEIFPPAFDAMLPVIKDHNEDERAKLLRTPVTRGRK